MTEELVRDNPAVAQYQHDLAANHANIGRVQLGQPAEACDPSRRPEKSWIGSIAPTRM